MIKNKKHILLLLTNYRVCEKLIGCIPLLSEYFLMDCYMIGQMSLNTRWSGDKDLRKIFVDNYGKYFKKIINGKGIPSMGAHIKDLLDNIKLDDYCAILYDDNRIQDQYQIPLLYSKAKEKKILVIGNSHGNQEYKAGHIPGLQKSYDMCFVLGNKEVDFYSKLYGDCIFSGGIPSNDVLKNYRPCGEHILCITNFLGNMKSLFEVNFDKDWANLLINLNKKLGKKIVIKQKHRITDPNYNNNIEYISKLMHECKDFTIISDSRDISLLISQSSLVISAFSTLAFKPIQLKIPTIFIDRSGQVANFYDYPFITTTDIDKFLNVYEKAKYVDSSFIDNWLENTIEGGKDFKSSKIYVSKLVKLIYETR